MTDKLSNWLADVETLFVSRYCIDLVDLGWDEQIKAKYFAFGLEPSEFAQWFGEKYDLVEHTSTFGLTKVP